MRVNFLLVAIILILIQSIATAQHPNVKQKDFSEKSWKDATEGLDYTVTPKEDKTQKVSKESDFSFFSFNSTTAKIILFTLVIVFLLIIAWMLFRNYVPSPTAHIPVNKDSDLDEDIYEINLEQMLKSALEIKDYKQALRYYYLIILKMLASKNLIDWKKEKTNYDYLREMKHSDYYLDFRSLTGLFENIWYSDVIPEEYFYNTVSQGFKNFIEQNQ